MFTNWKKRCQELSRHIEHLLEHHELMSEKLQQQNVEIYFLRKKVEELEKTQVVKVSPPVHLRRVK